MYLDNVDLEYQRLVHIERTGGGVAKTARGRGTATTLGAGGGGSLVFLGQAANAVWKRNMDHLRLART